MTELRFADVRGTRSDGSVTLIEANSGNALAVFTAPLAKVVYQKRLTVTAEAYAADEAVGGLLEPVGLGTSGRIIDARVYDNANQSVAYDLFLSTDPGFTITTDGAAFAPTDGELIRQGVAPVPIANAYSYSTNAVIVSGPVEYLYRTNDGGLYGQLVTRGAPTYAAATDVLVEITFEVLVA